MKRTVFLLSLLVVLGVGSARAQSRVDIAKSAAPASISDGAAVIDRDTSGAFVTIMEGTNDWVCLADENPVADGDYPVCIDEAWQEFFAAYSERRTPEFTGLGISYMLQGGPAASNQDPFAEEPAPGHDWVMDGPHIMVIVPDPELLAGFSTDHESGMPYVMWSGTPYAHLMVPTHR